jgi:hypothetical protein
MPLGSIGLLVAVPLAVLTGRAISRQAWGKLALFALAVGLMAALIPSVPLWTVMLLSIGFGFLYDRLLRRRQIYSSPRQSRDGRLSDQH